MKFWFILSALFFSFNAFSAVTILSVSGASRVEQTPPAIVWGVFVGVADPSQRLPYNNCGFDLPTDDDGNSLFEGCHPGRVNGNTDITVTFRESENIENSVPLAIIRGQNNNNIVLNPNQNPAGQSGANQIGSVTFSWADICQRLNDGTGSGGAIITSGTGPETRIECQMDNTPINGNVRITFGFGQRNGNTHDPSSNTDVEFNLYSPDRSLGIINQNDSSAPPPTPTPDCQNTPSRDFGFCDISIFPGDGGAFLAPREDRPRVNQVTGRNPSLTILGAFTNEPATFSIRPIGARIFISRAAEFTFAQAQPINGLFGDALRPEGENGSDVTFINNGEIDNLTLENTLEYVARAATIDNSGTISQLMDAVTYCPERPIPPSPTLPTACSTFASCKQSCPNFFFTPSEVAGIIAENSCFITSITYGSAQAYQVKLFREFRAKFLWTNYLGRKFSDLYNAYGPYGALWIKKHPESKTVMRVALYPFYGFAYLSVHYGFLFALSLYLLGLVFFFLGFKKIKAVIK